jgi:hypothetical protein
MIQRKGQPITGSRPEMKPTANVLTNANTSSSDAQRQIRRPPAPFASPNNAKNLPAQSNRSQIAGLPAANLHGGSAHGGYNVTHVGCTNTRLSAEERAAIGELSAPSGKGINPANSGFPLEGRSRQSGPAGARTTRRR